MKFSLFLLLLSMISSECLATKNRCVDLLKNFYSDAPKVLAEELNATAFRIYYFKKHPEEFRKVMNPFFKTITEAYDPSLQSEIERLETAISQVVAEKGLSIIEPFAIRGIKGNKTKTTRSRLQILKKLKEKGFMGSDGANFFVFDPEEGIFSKTIEDRESQDFGKPNPDRSMEAFFAKTYATSVSALRYADSDFPFIIFIGMNEDFILSPGRGNDGITGSSFPAEISINSSKQLILDNLDIANAVRPGVRRNGTGKIYDGVPAKNIKKMIFEDGIPESLRPKANGAEQTEINRMLTLSRIVYRETLKQIAINIDPIERARSAKASLRSFVESWPKKVKQNIVIGIGLEGTVEVRLIKELPEGFKIPAVIDGVIVDVRFVGSITRPPIYIGDPTFAEEVKTEIMDKLLGMGIKAEIEVKPDKDVGYRFYVKLDTQIKKNKMFESRVYFYQGLPVAWTVIPAIGDR